MWRLCEKSNQPIDGTPWPVWETPLKNYAGELSSGHLDFEEYLHKKCSEAEMRGETLRVLDIGMGSGRQWLDFLKTHKVEFFGTALAMTTVNPLLRKRTKLCTAAGLHKKFAANFFDVVVTHCGARDQELEAIENAVYVLKKGGEAAFVFQRFVFQDIVRMKVRIAAILGGRFELVDDTEKNGKGHLLHIRKL